MSKEVKKVSKVSKVSKKSSPDAESTAWNKGKEMTLHLCKVGGKTYRSIWQAWQEILGEKEALKSMSKCVRFRAKVKQAKGMKLPYKMPNGKVLTFEMIER
jgi:hypothetical protein